MIYSLASGKNILQTISLLSMTQQIKRHNWYSKYCSWSICWLSKNIWHKIILKKLEHYGARGLAKKLVLILSFQQTAPCNNKWNWLWNYTHFTWCTTGSVLGLLFFLININDLNAYIKRHFADDTNLLYIIECLKKRNQNPLRRLNIDQKSLNQRPIANKTSSNATQTELIYFRKY